MLQSGLIDFLSFHFQLQFDVSNAITPIFGINNFNQIFKKYIIVGRLCLCFVERMYVQSTEY